MQKKDSKVFNPSPGTVSPKAPEKKADIPAPVLSLDKYTPTTLTHIELQNTKAGNSIIQNPLEDWLSGKLQGVDIGKAPISVPVGITMSLSKGFTLPQGYSLSAEDDRYLNIAGSILHRTGHPDFTIRQLVNASRGLTDNPTVDAKTQEHVFNRLSTMMDVTVRLDLDNHRSYNAQNPKKKQLKDNYILAHLLPAQIAKIGGEYYVHMEGMPPLQSYAVQSGQIVTITQEQLDISHTFEHNTAGEITHTGTTGIKRITIQIQDIHQFIIKELQRARSQKVPCEFKYERLYEYLELGGGTFDRTKRSSKQRVDNNIEQVCEALKQKGDIKAYRVVGRGHIRKWKISITL